MKGLLYDGETPVPKEGHLLLKPQFFEFISGETKSQFSYSDILELETLGGEYRLELKNKTNPHINLILAFYSKEDYTSLIDNWKSYRKSGKRSLLPFWYDLSPWKKIFTLAVAATVVVVLYNVLLSMSHHFVPLSYDTSRVPLVSSKIREMLHVCSDRELNSFVDSLSKRLKHADDPFTYDIVVVQEEVNNAFALPGGNIILFTELLKDMESPEELAGVLAHEMAHVRKRHGIRNEIQFLGNFFFLSLAIGAGFEGVDFIENLDTFYEITSAAIFKQKFSREFEEEADSVALESLKSARISAKGFLDWFERMQKKYESDSESDSYAASIPSFLSSHPTTESRMNKIRGVLSDPSFPKDRIGISRRKWMDLRERCGPKMEESQQATVPN
ncbi:peptidase [Leptospira perolatii]|uniref:Peptidase n=1 Tax=Leptospira perolatii TaxID=2023191 RepID=A0A2M9ZS68_9LEPT|nr:M48 family metallopeptidase [Leptospira perolatii]PJZ71285.1 peptidase [Leptospira perolatii]PJZ74819.1 peptidase [Leptospira perolatii]